MYFNTLCLSGGGINGLQILGSLEYLKNNNILKIKNIKTFIGTSVGSIICFLINLNYDINFIACITYKLNMDKIKLDFDIDKFLENYGIDNGNKIISIIQTLLFYKIKKYDITFEELFKKTNKILKIIVVNYSDKKEEVFDYNTTPYLSVIYALRMSISIPFIFTPVKYNNKLYIDGGLMNNFGINYCNLDKTIAICIENQNNPDYPKTLFDYFKQILNIIYTNVTTKNIDHINIIKLDTTLTLSDFSLKKSKKFELLKNGYKKSKQYTKKLHFFAIKFIHNIIDKSILVVINQ